MNVARLFVPVTGLLLGILVLVPLQSMASSFGIFACAPVSSPCQDVYLTDPTGPLTQSALDTSTSGLVGEADISGNLGHVSGRTNAAVSVANVSGFLEYVDGMSAQTGSIWQDTWTVSGPGLAGTAGTLFASVVVDADALVSINTLPVGALGACAEAGWSFNVAGGNGGINLVNATGGNGLCEDEGGFYPQSFGSDGVFSFSVPIVFGAEHGWNIDWRATSNVYGWVDGGGGLTGSAELLFINTVQWLGISAVQDADGNPVAFDMVSDSGVDWTSPVPLQVVPLPASVWLLGTALAGLVIRRRQWPLSG